MRTMLGVGMATSYTAMCWFTGRMPIKERRWIQGFEFFKTREPTSFQGLHYVAQCRLTNRKNKGCSVLVDKWDGPHNDFVVKPPLWVMFTDDDDIWSERRLALYWEQARTHLPTGLLAISRAPRAPPRPLLVASDCS